MIYSDWLFETWLAKNGPNAENLFLSQSLLWLLWRFIWIEHFFPNSLHFFPAKKTQNLRRYGLPKLGPAGHFSIVGAWRLSKKTMDKKIAEEPHYACVVCVSSFVESIQKVEEEEEEDRSLLLVIPSFPFFLFYNNIVNVRIPLPLQSETHNI